MERVLLQWLGARSALIVHVQWLLQWRSSQPQDAAFDGCISATTVAVADAIASHGLRALQAPSVMAGIACIAHKENAALVLRSLLQCPQLCKDAAGHLCVHMDDSQMLHTVEVSVSRHMAESKDVPAGKAHMEYLH